MTEEEKQLLLVDLCARLPYGTIYNVSREQFYTEVINRFNKSKEEVELAFNGLSPYYAYKQGLQDGDAYTWESFRREAAKDILCAIIQFKGMSPCYINEAITYADELIKQLKEK